MKQTVFDIGMGFGSDTEYYLSEGYRVVGVEADPVRVAHLLKTFEREIAAGDLVLIAGAIAEEDGSATIYIGSGNVPDVSLERSFVRGVHRTAVVQTRSILSLIREYRKPYFIKIDIEGADHLAVLPLTEETAPTYLSFEATDRTLEMLGHMKRIGYSAFKIMNQALHREMSRVDYLPDRVVRKLRRIAGIEAPPYVVRNGRRFKTGGSSGPMPAYSDGKWHDYQTTVEMWAGHIDEPVCGGWWDIQGWKP